MNRKKNCVLELVDSKGELIIIRHIEEALEYIKNSKDREEQRVIMRYIERCI